MFGCWVVVFVLPFCDGFGLDNLSFVVWKGWYNILFGGWSGVGGGCLCGF